MIGIATHYTDGSLSACGITSPELQTQNVRSVDCVRCRRTHRYADAVAVSKRNQRPTKPRDT